VPLSWLTLSKALQEERIKGRKLLKWDGMVQLAARVDKTLTERDSLHQIARVCEKWGELVYFSEAEWGRVLILDIDWLSKVMGHIFQPGGELQGKEQVSTDELYRQWGKHMRELDCSADQFPLFVELLREFDLLFTLETSDRDGNQAAKAAPSLSDVHLVPLLMPTSLRVPQPISADCHLMGREYWFPWHVPHGLLERLAVKIFHRLPPANHTCSCHSFAFATFGNPCCNVLLQQHSDPARVSTIR